jgi:hypothetical protein
MRGWYDRLAVASVIVDSNPIHPKTKKKKERKKKRRKKERKKHA